MKFFLRTDKRKRFRPNGKFVTVATNLALSLILLSVALVCLFPIRTDTLASSSGEAKPYYHADESSDAVSLLINVYQNTDCVEEMLSVLDRHRAKATFFLGGCWADDNEKCVLEILSYGNEIGNHGYFHRDMDKLDREKNKQEILACNRYLQLITGVKVELFAPPSGAFNSDTLSVAKELGMKTVMWSKDTIDWRDQNSALIYRRATKDAKGGDFILMHPTKATVAALDDILRYYENRKLRVVTVSENLQFGG